MKIAFQMDPIQSVDINADSSFRLAEEAQARGHTLFFYSPDKLAYEEGRITARGHDMTVCRVLGDHVDLGAERQVDLSEFDVVWLRQDPPFDMHYITSTHLLDRLAPGTLVVIDYLQLLDQRRTNPSLQAQVEALGDPHARRPRHPHHPFPIGHTKCPMG